MNKQLLPFALLLVLISSCTSKEELKNPNSFVEHYIRFNEDFLQEENQSPQHYMVSYMKHFYLWNEKMEVPEDYLSYEDTTLLFETLKVEEDRFSWYKPLDNTVAFNNVWLLMQQYGIQMKFYEDHKTKILYVCNSSFTEETGLDRGMKLISTGGRDGSYWNEHGDELVEYLKGPYTEWTFQDRNGDFLTAELDHRQYGYNPLQGVTHFNLNDGRKTGYFSYLSFNMGEGYAMQQLFEQLLDSDIEELIVDLRVNHGGSSTVAMEMCSYITGDRFLGKKYCTFRFNRQNRQWNRYWSFEEQNFRFNLPRVVFLVSGDTASASEQVINSLKPYTDCVLIGEPTRGKSEFMYPFYQFTKGIKYEFNPISGTNENSRREMVPLDGFQPDILMEEKELYPFGDSEDPMITAALEYLEDNPEPRKPQEGPSLKGIWNSWLK